MYEIFLPYSLLLSLQWEDKTARLVATWFETCAQNNQIRSIRSFQNVHSKVDLRMHMEWKTFYLFNSMLTLKNWLLTGEDFRLFFKSPIEKNSNNNPLLHVFTQTSIRHLIVDFARVYRAVDPGGYCSLYGVWRYVRSQRIGFSAVFVIIGVSI